MKDGPLTGPAVAQGPTTDAKKIWADALANQKKLEGCAHPHDFERVDPTKPLGNYRCTKCGGSISGHGGLWYMTGLKHAKSK